MHLKGVGAGLLALAVTACQLNPSNGFSQVSDSQQDAVLYPPLIRRLLTQGQYYAALAHVQEAQQKQAATAELRYLEAEARRHLNQSAQARTLYSSLLNEPDYAGLAYQGLAKTMVRQDPDLALKYFQQAVQARPTDPWIRNDLGFALLQQQKPSQARLELATAFELAPQQPQIRANFLLCLWIQGDTKAFERLAKGLSEAQIDRLKIQAETMKKKA